MLILQRITVYLLTILSAFMYFVLWSRPEALLGLLVFSLFIFIVLLARLLKFEVKSLPFWIFFSLPLMLLLASFLLFFFTESPVTIFIGGLFITGLIWVFLESLYTFYYFPANYQPYSLEYLALSMYVVMTFALCSGSYALLLFIQVLPVWLPVIILFAFFVFSIVCMFWVSKVHIESSLIYGLVGALALTQLFLAISFLPTSFMVNGAVLAIFFYMFLGISRAHILERLSKVVLRRYLLSGILGIILLLITTKWF